MFQDKNRFSFWRPSAWIALALLVLITLVIVGVPVWIIRPFAPQTARGLEVSYALRRWSPPVTIAISLAAVALAWWLWRGTRSWWRRAVLIVPVILVLALTWFARQNYFEWMFNPLHNPAYAKASEATFVADTDMVMTVENNGEAVAYPIRQMAYHHVVQDTVGGTPIAVTY